MPRRRNFAAAFIFALAVHAGAGGEARAQYCDGVVHGLSGRYNPATGSGFLALRAGPHAAATQTGELFNGDHTEILGRRGSWYRIAFRGMDGWASASFIRNSCGY